MRSVDEIMRDRQREVRRVIDKDGYSLKAIASLADIPLPTLMSYFRIGEVQTAVMPLTAVYALIESKALPLDLISMLLPNGAMVVRVPEEIDHDEIEDVCRDYLKTKGEAHHPNSPAGRELADCEKKRLSEKATQLQAVGK